MKILVLGGTGAMGLHIVKLLVERGNQLTVTTRQDRKSIENLKYIKGNAHEYYFLKELLIENWDAIIDFMVYSTSEFKEKIQNLLAATSQYVYLSSARVYADYDTPISEKSPRLLDVSNDRDYLSTDEYALKKARQENILIETGKRNWTIIRPYITYSENRLQLGVLEKEEWLYRALRGRTIVFSSDIARKYTTLTYGYDVAKGILAILMKENAFGKAFHITVNENKKWEEILKAYLSTIELHLGIKPKYKLLSIDEFFKIKPVVYQVRYDRLYNRKFDTTAIKPFIESDQFEPIISGITHCLNRFIAEPEFKQINWKSEAIKDKLCNEHASYKEIESFRNKIKYFFYRYIKYYG